MFVVDCSFIGGRGTCGGEGGAKGAVGKMKGFRKVGATERTTVKHRRGSSHSAAERTGGHL